MINKKRLYFYTVITVLFVIVLGCGSADHQYTSQKNEKEIMGVSLQDILAKESSDPNFIGDNEYINVLIGLKDEGEEQDNSYGTGTVEDGKEIIVTDGVRESENVLQQRAEARKERRKIQLQELAKLNGWENEPFMISAINSDTDVFSVILPIKKGEILGFIQKSRAIIIAIDIYIEPQTE